MSDLQTPWHRIMLLKKKLGDYTERVERKDQLKEKAWREKWVSKVKK